MAEIIITSHHTVKPSSPTPLASKIHKLSIFDQIAPPIYIPLIFFYKNDESNSMQHDEISRRLKQSLSEILTIFYPLVGTLNHNSYVDCNDRGAEFVEARVHAHLQEFIENPKMEELKKLLSTDSSSYNGDNAVEMLVKTTFFDCGGFSVGICLSHKIGDAASVVAFMNAWASTCRNGEASGIIHPSFDLGLRFPRRDLPTLTSGSKVKNIVTKRLVFEREKVEKLRRDASSDRVKDPSRVEAVSAFIWRSFIEANKAKTTSSLAASHTVNIRPRAVLHPIPDHMFGNCVTAVFASISPEEDDEGGRKSCLLVSKLRAVIRAVNDHYIKNGTKGDGDTNLIKEINDMYESQFCINFTSLLRYPVYEVDFGWGKPVWVCMATMPYPDQVVLIDTPTGDGVEAWINVPDQHFFELLQHNYNNLLH